ncbi:cytidylate kinase [Allostella sp. ATCC 35155]|nr:cytidylate kinase [Stella sp. ATCC 35155]
MIIAIDGPAAAGKGTLARRLAAHFGYPHLDTGALYRAVARRLLEAGRAPDDAAAAVAAAEALSSDELASPRLRDEEVGRATSVLAAIPAVRAALLAFQRRFAATPPGAVLDGRDIGTVVCPEAEVKVFLVADAAERARRRAKELQDRGVPAIEARILQDIQERDARDSGRSTAPLSQAEDAFVLDTTQLDPEAAFRAVLAHIASRAR